MVRSHSTSAPVVARMSVAMAEPPAPLLPDQTRRVKRQDLVPYRTTAPGTYKHNMDSPPYTADRTIGLSARSRAAVVLALLALSLLLVAGAAFFMPDSYNWVAQTTSESAAQGVDNAWIARTGFVLMGFAVLLLAPLAGRRWGLWGRLVFRVYGVSMILTAVFSNKPWEAVQFVEFEDTLHSWASSIVGFAFIAGVLVVMLRRPMSDRAGRLFDWTAIIAALGITAVIFAFEDIAGVSQRSMFLIAYAWFGAEAVKSAADDPHTAEAMARRMAA